MNRKGLYISLLLLVFAVAAALRIADIETKNLWFDEVYSWKISQGSIIKIFQESAGDIHPPFYYLVLKLWTAVFGDTVFSMRMLSALFSVAAMYVLYLLTLRLDLSRREILLVLLLYAVSPLNIFYSQEVRMLSLNLLFTLSSVLLMLKYLDKPDGKTGVLYTVFTGLALYTHYFAMFILIAEIIYTLLVYFKLPEAGKRITPFLKYPVFAIVMFMPWLPIMAGQAMRGQPWRKAQSLQQVAEDLFVFFKDMFLSVYFQYESMMVTYVSHVLSLAVIFFIILVIFRLVNSGDLFSHKANVVVLLLIVPLTFAVIISLRQSIVFSRYLSIIVPYLMIFVVYYSFRFFKRKTAAGICLALVAVSIAGVSINYSNGFKNNDYRRIIRYISENQNPGDKLVVEPHFMGWVFNYHNLHSESKVPAPTVFGWDLGMQTDSIGKSADPENIWFVLDYSSLSKSTYDNLEQTMAGIGYEAVSQKTFYLIPEKTRVLYFKKMKEEKKPK